MKKFILGLGSATAVVAPVASVIACSNAESPLKDGNTYVADIAANQVDSAAYAATSSAATSVTVDNTNAAAIATLIAAKLIAFDGEHPGFRKDIKKLEVKVKFTVSGTVKIATTTIAENQWADESELGVVQLSSSTDDVRDAIKSHLATDWTIVTS